MTTNFRDRPNKAVERAKLAIAANMSRDRKMQRTKISDLAKESGLSAPTVSRLLNDGEGSLEAFLRVAHSLGILPHIIEATDLLHTSRGRKRVDEELPERVRG